MSACAGGSSIYDVRKILTFNPLSTAIPKSMNPYLPVDIHTQVTRHEIDRCMISYEITILDISSIKQVNILNSKHNI
jgi:hypothetical protein